MPRHRKMSLSDAEVDAIYNAHVYGYMSSGKTRRRVKRQLARRERAVLKRELNKEMYDG